MMGRKRYVSLLLALAFFLSVLTGSVLSRDSVHATRVESINNSKGIGTENRNWVIAAETPPTSTERYPVTVTEDVTITMRDGVRLKGRLFVPDLPDGPSACVLYPNGYGHGSPYAAENAVPRDLAERGYASLHVSMRGTAPSEGTGNLYNKYGEDGYDLVEWMANQSWCDGNVGTIGSSLRGINQWLIAKELPPSLKAISPIVACGDCYNYLWYPGGMQPGPGRIARGVPEYSSAIEHRNFDDWWRERSTLKEDLEAIADRGIAALISGGWNDYISPGNVQAFKDFSAAGGKAKLIMGPGAHGSVQGLLPYNFLDYQVLWFDHYLKGIDNGIDREDGVLIYVQGPNQYRYEKAWPIPDTKMARLYLSKEKSGTINSLNDGSLSIKRTNRQKLSTSYSYSPSSGPFLPTMLSTSAGRLKIDQKPYEEQTVTWTTGFLPVPIEVTGTLSLTFWAEANAVDSDFVVQVTDVALNGMSTQVSAGYLNASRAKSRTISTPLTPGKVEKYNIKILPTSYVFEAGHRLRLSIAGGTKALPEQTGPQGPGLNPVPASVKIYQDDLHPSSLDLPVIGASYMSKQ
ncbi:CocE/NonD family hydrolase [Fictibacillus terranigra]|uniref:CocE/NonD family hydrolase n=1 Tax=Fictibacillus terranigra TaxID=3058424 RepID=A0ABT8E7H3_9BACL|nr:CocE/NonD family hydrolase [Fictibacillus sp. CENA-BCM004]MDN4073866.1 CocE/NonD family hydrolase [Fictibacillus sp. CENA-BCM004]